MKRILAILIICSALWGQSALAQKFPALGGRVVDEAALLSPAEEAALSAKLQALEQSTQRQIVIATLADLQGYDIADYGYRLGRYWGIGDKQRNDGALLIIAPKERKLRIEVGYGLESVLTDAVSSQIIRNDITPQFKAGNFPAGINAGADKMIALLQLSPEEAQKVAAEAAKAEKEAADEGDFGGIIFWLFRFFFFILPLIRSFRNGGRSHARGGVGAPVIIWGGGGFGGRSGGGFGGGGASGGW